MPLTNINVLDTRPQHTFVLHKVILATLSFGRRRNQILTSFPVRHSSCTYVALAGVVKCADILGNHLVLVNVHVDALTELPTPFNPRSQRKMEWEDSFCPSVGWRGVPSFSSGGVAFQSSSLLGGAAVWWSCFLLPFCCPLRRCCFPSLGVEHLLPFLIWSGAAFPPPLGRCWEVLFALLLTWR